MSKYQYKNETENDLVLVGVGIVEAGNVIESSSPIENPHLTLVDTKSDKKKPLNKEPGDVE